jgi:hypothetical protein
MKKIMYLLSIGIMVILMGCGSVSMPAASKGATITKAEFDKIQNGMSYDEVTAIIGGQGELQVEGGTKGNPDYTASYSYKGDGDIGANAQLMFQGGKLNMKAQMGLK